MDRETCLALYAVPVAMVVIGAVLLFIGAQVAFTAAPAPRVDPGYPPCPPTCPQSLPSPPPPTINPVPLVGAGLAIAGVMVGMALQVWRGDERATSLPTGPNGVRAAPEDGPE